MVITNRGRVTANPFLNFLREVRGRPSNEGKTAGQLAKIGAEEWNRMTNEAKEPFRKSAQRYQIIARRSGRLATSTTKKTRKRQRSTSKRGRARSTVRRRRAKTSTAPTTRKYRSPMQRQAIAIALSMQRRRRMLERQEISRRRSKSRAKSTSRRRSRRTSASRSRPRSKARIMTPQYRWRVHKKAESISRAMQRRERMLEQRRGKSRPRSKKK